MIVVDASPVLELLLNTPVGRLVRERIASAKVSLHAPHLLDLEVAQALRRYVREGRLSAERGRMALTYLGELDIARYPHDVLLPRIWSLRHNLTAYDAAYVSLAEALGAVLLTCDGRLAAAPGHRAEIELVAGSRP